LIGILAYGSLTADPGAEISAATQRILDDLLTPFAVEYARSSQGRAGAPTLVPVEPGQGGQVKARVYLLKPELSGQQAQDILYRRERNRVGEPFPYSPPRRVNVNTVLVESLAGFAGVDLVFYTRLGANLPEVLDPDLPPGDKAHLLARRSAASLTHETWAQKRDGIQYLLDNLAAGIETPLSHPYAAALLDLAGGAPDLAEARRRIARQKGIIP
jgi:hypothetical protein